MEFKFLRGNSSSLFQLEPMQTLSLRPYLRFNPQNVEFCFQFDDEEPPVFASGPNECHITINPTAEGNIHFHHNGRIFKLFARERQ